MCHPHSWGAFTIKYLYLENVTEVEKKFRDVAAAIIQDTSLNRRDFVFAQISCPLPFCGWLVCSF